MKLVSTPATEVRVITSMLPVAVAPGTALQVLILPVKMAVSWLCVRLLSGLDLFVTTQIAYRAIG